MLDEISQRKKNTVRFILYVESTKTNKTKTISSQIQRAEWWLQRRGVEVREMGENKQANK